MSKTLQSNVVQGKVAEHAGLRCFEDEPIQRNETSNTSQFYNPLYRCTSLVVQSLSSETDQEQCKCSRPAIILTRQKGSVNLFLANHAIKRYLDYQPPSF
jgi:hypothetical protein